MRKCFLCGKKTSVGRNRSHAQNRTPRVFKANIQRVTINTGTEKVKGNFCTKCLKKIKVEMQQKTALV